MLDYTLEKSKTELVGSMRKTAAVAESTVALLGAELSWLRARRDMFDDHSTTTLIERVADFREIAGSTANLLKDFLGLAELYDRDPASYNKHDEDEDEEKW